MKKAVKVVSLVVAACGVTAVVAVMAMSAIVAYAESYGDNEYLYGEDLD